MIGIFLSIVLAFILVVFLMESIKDKDPGMFFGSLALVGVLAAFGLFAPTMFIEDKTHIDHGSFGDKLRYERVEKFGDRYVFELEDGTLVSDIDKELIVLDPAEDSGIEIGRTYGSWGIFWPSEDWTKGEVIRWTPSNS